jgi:hypothetical protein
MSDNDLLKEYQACFERAIAAGLSPEDAKIIVSNNLARLAVRKGWYDK